MYVDAPHVRSWLERHDAQVVNSGVSTQFETYLAGLPWAGSHIDWRQIPYEVIELPVEVDTGTLARCAKTTWGRHGNVLIMYNGEEPAIVCDLETALVDLDLLYSAAPGTRFICGLRADEHGMTPFFDDFAEFDGSSVLTFRR